MYYKMPLKLLITKCFLLSGILFFQFFCSNSGEKDLPGKKKADTSVKNKPTVALEAKEAFNILKFLVDEEAKSDKKAKVDYKNYSVSFTNDDDPYEVSYSKLVEEDLNRDGLTDYILTRDSEGMLGGNANTNSSILYLIMGPENQIVQRHKILIYAPFSYNILDDIHYKKGKLKATATQNFRTYMPEEGSELQSTSLSFVFKNGNVFEESYLSGCELAKWENKQFFNQNSEVTRTIEIHNYTEEVHENFSTREFDFSAIFSGCDNLNLILKGSFPYRGKKQEFLIEKRDRFLQYLKDHTPLTKEIKAIQSYFADANLSEEAVELDGFTFYLFTTHEKGKTTFRLILDQMKNPEQTENWEITTRNSIH